jgi:hypothetical protein
MPRQNAGSVSHSRLHWLVLPGLLAAGVVVLIMLQPWSSNAQSGPSQRDEFAADREAPSGGEKPVPFDGKRAMDYLEEVCKIGPRISGTAGMTKQQELLEKHFADRGGKVSYQRFTARQKSVKKPVEMANMVIAYHPERARRVILCSHYDTRPIADQEPNPRRWNDPFISANDGGSGAAMLMELANHMKDLKSSVGIDLVLFDGEEYIFDPSGDEYFFGSKHFGREYAKVRRKTTYVGAVLLDMVGGKGATFPVEGNSNVRAGKLVKEVWGIARELGCAAFQNRLGSDVLDDHVALNAAGIPAIDIIDFDYPHWHRLTDLPKNCAAGPMEQVAKVCSVWLQRAK